MLVLITFVDLL